MPLFLQIALGIVVAILGLVLIFTGPRFLAALADETMRGNIAQMAGKGMLLISLPLMTIMIVRVCRELSNPEHMDKVVFDPLSLMGMLAIVLGAGLHFLGDKREDRSKKKAESNP